MVLDSSILRTDVDDFLSLVQKMGKITLSGAAKQMGVSESTVESWADFLVEEKILGIEYKFTTPYIFMNINDRVKSRSSFSGFEIKEAFFNKASKRNIPRYQAVLLWTKYLSANQDSIKIAFMEKVKERGLPPEKGHMLWKKYYDLLRSG
ncbi:hypothetical protein JXB31_05720 [Candidatus Woesearchaeota archaeon]|nr:hypothetical protein [Candidatus Woesearchaeota archaeon]